MPSKHVDDQTWRQVEKETVKAVGLTQTAFKDTEILKILIRKGLQEISEDDYEEAARLKRKKR